MVQRRKIGITIDAHDFIQALKRAPKTFQKESKKAMKEIGPLIEGHAKRKCPRRGWTIGKVKLPHNIIQKLMMLDWTNTGLLRGSIRTLDTKWNYVVVGVGDKDRLQYAKWVHGGTRWMPARPFMEEGLKSARADSIALIRRAANNTLMSLRGR